MSQLNWDQKRPRKLSPPKLPSKGRRHNISLLPPAGRYIIFPVCEQKRKGEVQTNRNEKDKQQQKYPIPFTSGKDEYFANLLEIHGYAVFQTQVTEISGE